jgi:uroporphyrinogen decarboxylase
MRTNPDRLQTGLNAITETTLRFIEALKRTSISGINFVVEHAHYDVLSAEEYQTFGLPYDRKLLDTLPSRWWLNVLNIRGKAPMFRFIDHYPVSVVNWEDYEEEPDLARGKSLVRGAVCGGLSARDHVHYGTPASIRDAARKAISQVNARRFILSTGLPLLVSSPLSNLRAVSEVAKQAGA